MGAGLDAVCKKKEKKKTRRLIIQNVYTKHHLCAIIEMVKICVSDWRKTMPREKKDARILNIKLATPVYDRLDAFCSESGLSKTVAAEKILMQFFDAYFERPEDERIIFHAVRDDMEAGEQG